MPGRERLLDEVMREIVQSFLLKNFVSLIKLEARLRARPQLHSCGTEISFLRDI